MWIKKIINTNNQKMVVQNWAASKSYTCIIYQKHAYLTFYVLQLLGEITQKQMNVTVLLAFSLITANLCDLAYTV